MSRRSSRLLSGGYYNSEDDSDSSSVTNISYRENAVKVFKKKAGPRKAASRTPSRAVGDASSLDPEPHASAGLSPSQLSQTEPTMRTVPYVSTGVTPRPPLTPRTPLTPRPPLTTSASRDQMPAPRPSAPPERSLNARLRVTSQVALHLQPNHKELSQSGVDSSGYSSSEGPRRKPPDPSSTSGAPSTGYWDRISCAVFNLMNSVSLMAAALQKHLKHLTASAGGRMMKACGLLFLLFIALLCVWLLLPFLTFLVTRMAVATPENQPVLPAATLPLAPPPPPQRDAVHPVVDPAVVSAAVEERIRHVLAEQQLKQQHLLSQVTERLQLDLQDMKKQLQLDLQDMKAQLAAVDSDERLRLEQELSGLGEQMVDYRSTAAVLGLRIQDLEAQNAKLSQEWSSIQLIPPHNPSPETSNPPVQNQLTPELQQALEKWLTDRIKQQEAVRLADGGSCSACVRPVADKMADFALETQGASVVSTRCSETYRTRSACVTLFGFPLWYPSESPRTVIQGYPVMLPGKCWAFHGVQGTLVISLSHPITLTHVTLDHLPRYNSPTGRIDSAPKDFEVYGMKDEVEEGTLLGSFRYDEDGEPTQTFGLPNPSGEVHRSVELRVLTNWGHVEYTCLYRFRVHGEIAAAR